MSIANNPEPRIKDIEVTDDSIVAVISVYIRLAKYAGTRYTEATHIGKIIARFVLDYSR